MDSERAPTLESLPSELISAILAYVPPRAIRLLLSCSRTLFTVALPTFYKRVAVLSPERQQLLVEAVLKHERREYLSAVRAVRLQLPGQTGLPTDGGQGNDEIPDATVTSNSIDTPDSASDSGSCQVRKEFLEVFGPNLTTLELDWLAPFDAELLESLKPLPLEGFVDLLAETDSLAPGVRSLRLMGKGFHAEMGREVLELVAGRMGRGPNWSNLVSLDLATAVSPDSDFSELSSSPSLSKRAPQLSKLTIRKPTSVRHGSTKLATISRLLSCHKITDLNLDFGFKTTLWERQSDLVPLPHLKNLEIDGLLFTQIRGSAILSFLSTAQHIRLSIREEPIFFINDLNQLEEIFNKTIGTEVKALVDSARGSIEKNKAGTTLDVCVPIMQPERADRSSRMWTEAVGEVFSGNQTLMTRSWSAVEGEPRLPGYWGQAPLSVRIRLEFASEALSNPVWWGPGWQFKPVDPENKGARISRTLEFTAALY